MSTDKVIRFAQVLLLDGDRKTVSPARINEVLDQVLMFQPDWATGFDREMAIAELVRRFSLWVGEDTSLTDKEGHEPWLNADRKTDWRYWTRYREYLEAKMGESAISALDRSTDNILGMLEDPQRDGPWDRRGLVVGHVQSGKTGNYTGLICKAADAGYKIIIVLAGLHNNLRAQTQMRLDEGFLGYETKPIAEDMRAIGVGLIDRDPSIRPNYVTNRTERGDFTTQKANGLGISPEQRPWLFVIKKNKTVLERLLGWLKARVSDAHDPETGRPLITSLPLLMIDDEADHASVDTGEQIYDENGTPDPEHEPTAINRLTRTILHTFTRSAYVGYTATPFANIFIHERNETKDEGPDLFPSSFIVNLSAPSTYVGPAQVFGLKSSDGRTDGLPLFRAVSDHTNEEGTSGWMPHKHKIGHIPKIDRESGLPESLEQAIDAFILGCAVRNLRGQANDHASMLIHVTRFTSVQKEVSSRVSEHVSRMSQRFARNIGVQQAEERLERLWREDFIPTNERSNALFPDFTEGLPLPDWETVRQALPAALADIEVRMINGTAKDALDYADNTAKGLRIIAVGGDKLSRGLTLEGLTTSYFLRTSKMYDSLMQMGRWFGYRPGYIDLCRLYTTSELAEWFGHIADASEELREEFDLMVASGGTPRDYGLKVQSHPVLTVTSRLKMRSARSLWLSFSGQISETVSLFADVPPLNANLTAVRNLVTSLGNGEKDPVKARPDDEHRWKGKLWNDVEARHVIDFLTAYATHPDAYKVNSTLLAKFIEKMNNVGELEKWNVAVIGSGNGTPFTLVKGLEIGMLKRKSAGKPGRYAIGRLLSPRDEAIDLDGEQWSAALRFTRDVWHKDPARRNDQEPTDPSGTAIRHIRGLQRAGETAADRKGLLLIYLLDPDRAEDPNLKGLPPVATFALSFPASEKGEKVEYKVNNVEWTQEYGGAD